MNDAMTEDDLSILAAADARPLLYVAGPMTSYGHAYGNVRNGILAGEAAFEKGWAPIVPHLSALWEMVSGATGHRRWIELDYAYIRSSDAILFLPDWDKSKGALAEDRLARYTGKIRFFGLENLPTAADYWRMAWDSALTRRGFRG